MNTDFHDFNLSRRQIIKSGILASLGLPFLSLARAKTPSPQGAAPAKAVIEIWMWGGPSHLDTFDPKPEAGAAFSGPFNQAIETKAKGIRINGQLPLLAQQADKYSIIRSMTHGVNAHETATYRMQTGRSSGDGDVYRSIGAVVSKLLGYDNGYKGLLPPYIALTSSHGRFSEEGFFGPNYKPFATGGDPNADRFLVNGVIAKGISDAQQKSRREFLHNLDTLGKLIPDNPLFQQMDACEGKAYDMILGDARDVFDLSQESDATRERYGRNTFGQSCLMARRLVEAGVKYITINAQGWDTHKMHFEAMARKMPEMDRGMATLLEDLSERGLLDSTIVWSSGEFGRTPRVQWEEPWKGGRGHFGRCFSSIVAGGGFSGGQVIGSTDATGEDIDDRPVWPQDLHASIYKQLGIDPSKRLPNTLGLDVPIAEASEGKGILTEIM